MTPRSRPKLSARRRRVVVLCACAAAMSGGGTLMHDHPVGRVVWLLVMLALFGVAITEFVKLKKEEG